MSRGKKRKTADNNNGSNKKSAHKTAIRVEIDQLSLLVGLIESEDEVAAFYDYYASLNNSPSGKDKQFAVEAYLDELGDAECQARIWISVHVYATMGRIPSYFLNSTPQRYHSMLWLDEIQCVANTISNLALQNRLDVLAEDDSVKRAMETKGRARGAEILKAYIHGCVQTANWRSRAHGGDDGLQAEGESGRSLSEQPASAVDDQPGVLRSPSREQSVKVEEFQEDEMQVDENLYNDDNRSRVGRQSSEQGGSSIVGRETESPALPLGEEITASASVLASCQVKSANLNSAANKVRKRYKNLNNQLIHSLAKLLAEDTVRHGDEVTIQLVEAKAKLCNEFGREKSERIRGMFKEPLDQEIDALEALRLAESNHSALLERRTLQDLESDDQWEI